MYSGELDVEALRRAVGGWILSNMANPISFSSYDEDDWSILPPSLGWMRQMYAHRYVREQLGMSPHTIVEVQGK